MFHFSLEMAALQSTRRVYKAYRSQIREPFADPGDEIERALIGPMQIFEGEDNRTRPAQCGNPIQQKRDNSLLPRSLHVQPDVEALIPLL